MGKITLIGSILISLLLMSQIIPATGNAADNSETSESISIIKEPDSISWFNQGEALLEAGRFNDSIEAYDRAIQLDPSNIEALNKKAYALDSLGRYESAIQCLNRSLEIDPWNAFALREKGWALNRLGRYYEALECLNMSILADPQNSFGWKEKAWTLNELGLYWDAIQNANMSILIDSKYADAWNEKGFAFSSLGLEFAANEAFARANAVEAPIVKAIGAEEDVTGAKAF
jgi:tetratricopeptide (TPR) repeat protein